MEKDKVSGFYVIDALALKQPARKPFHLEQRLRAKHRRSSGKVAHQSHHEERSNKEFLEARRSKLAKRNSHVRSVMYAKRKETHMSETATKKKLAETMAAAEKKRANILDSQVCLRDFVTSINTLAHSVYVILVVMIGYGAYQFERWLYHLRFVIPIINLL
jgi:menaquinone-dependent protoporphyrinogen IX oxidase